MEHCCHACADAPSCYWAMLDKLQERVCRTVGPSLAASLEPLAYWLFLSPLQDVIRVSISTVNLWNSLSAECFPLTYGLNGFKSRVNRYVLPLGSL